MSTKVWIIVCQQPPNEFGSSLSQQCPSWQRLVIQTSVEQLTETATQPFPKLDPASVGQIFSFGFGLVMLFFLVSRGAGVVLQMIRRA